MQLVCIHILHWLHWTQSTVSLIALSFSSIHTLQHFGSVFIRLLLHCASCSREGFASFGFDAVLFTLVDLNLHCFSLLTFGAYVCFFGNVFGSFSAVASWKTALLTWSSVDFNTSSYSHFSTISLRSLRLYCNLAFV